MASEPIRSTTVITAPKDYTIPGAQQIRPLSIRASFDGTGAGGAYLPAVQILDNNGNVLSTHADPNVSVAAGASADVTWFPGVKPQASSKSSVQTAPSVATFYRRVSQGDAAQTVNAGATANLVWPNAALPSDGSITGPIIGNVFASINIDCIAIQYLRVGWEDGAYSKACVIGTNSRDVQADVVSPANWMNGASPLRVDTNDWVIDAMPGAFKNGDLSHCYAINGDAVPRNINEAYYVIQVWPAPGYTGNIPDYPH